MHVDADRGGYARPVEHNDQRITKVGRVSAAAQIGRDTSALQHSFGRYVFRRTSSFRSRTGTGVREPDTAVRAALDGETRSYWVGAGAARILCVAPGQH